MHRSEPEHEQPPAVRAAVQRKRHGVEGKLVLIQDTRRVKDLALLRLFTH